MNDPVQGITSTTQEAPATAAEVNDVMTGLGAGVGIGDLIQPKPDPIREYTVFLVNMWDTLFDSAYTTDESHITAGSWIEGPTGTLTATNENGVAVEIDVTLSLELLPEQFGEIDQETLDIIESASARFGIAWTTITNQNLTSVNTLVFWCQNASPDGLSTTILPLTTVAQDDIDLFNEILPYMGDFFEDPLRYNIENYDPATFSAWSRFRSRVESAVVIVAASIVTAAVVVVIIVIAPVATPVVIAAAALAGAVAGGATYLAGETTLALRDLLYDLGHGPAVHSALIRALLDMLNSYSRTLV